MCFPINCSHLNYDTHTSPNVKFASSFLFSPPKIECKYQLLCSSWAWGLMLLSSSSAAIVSWILTCRLIPPQRPIIPFPFCVGAETGSLGGSPGKGCRFTLVRGHSCWGTSLSISSRKRKKTYDEDVYLFQCRTHYLQYYKLENIVYSMYLPFGHSATVILDIPRNCSCRHGRCDKPSAGGHSSPQRRYSPAAETQLLLLPPWVFNSF